MEEIVAITYNQYDLTKEIVAIIGLCILVILILFGIFSQIINHISKKKLFHDTKLGSVYKYYGYDGMKDPFKRVLYYFQIIDKKDGYFQYKKYRSYFDIAKDDYVLIESENINTMRRMILNSDFVEMTTVNYDKERI